MVYLERIQHMPKTFNVKTGVCHVKHPQLELKPGMRFSALDWLLRNNPSLSLWTIGDQFELYGLSQVALDRWLFHLMLCFYEGRLSGFLLRLDFGNPGRTDELFEARRYRHHQRILYHWFKTKPPFRYHWGEVVLEHDVNRGGSEIRVIYRPIGIANERPRT